MLNSAPASRPSAHFVCARGSSFRRSGSGRLRALCQGGIARLPGLPHSGRHRRVRRPVWWLFFGLVWRGSCL